MKSGKTLDKECIILWLTVNNYFTKFFYFTQLDIQSVDIFKENMRYVLNIYINCKLLNRIIKCDVNL